MLLCSQVLQNDRYDSVKEFQCVNKLVYVLTWLELKISRLTSVLMSTHKLLLPNKSLCLYLVNSSTRPYQSLSEGYVLSLCDAPG